MEKITPVLSVASDATSIPFWQKWKKIIMRLLTMHRVIRKAIGSADKTNSNQKHEALCSPLFLIWAQLHTPFMLLDRKKQHFLLLVMSTYMAVCLFQLTSVLCIAQWQLGVMIADGLVPASPILQSFKRTQAQQFTQKEARETLNNTV